MAIFNAPGEQQTSLKKLKRSHATNPSNTYYTTINAGANHSINSLPLSGYRKDIRNLPIYTQYDIPESHKRIADSYLFVSRVFGTPVVHSSLTEEEKKHLMRFDFYTLEYTTSHQMEQELTFLKKWSKEKDKDLREAADKVLQIRSKELKHIIATNYVTVKKDFYDGYKVLDRYFNAISKYSK
jgi:F420-0:gamma-glutamyl ligase-like protein